MANYPLKINLFAAVVNKTTNSGLSATMQTYYDKKLLEDAKPKLVHAQFADKRPLPLNNGKSVSFRKWTPFAAATTALTEGTPPDGQALAMTQVTATISQYGGYVTVTDLLDMTALDNVILGATELMADQAALTIDTLTRDALHGGANVVYGEDSSGEAASRSAITADHKLTLKTLHKAVLQLKTNRAPRFEDGCYVAIVHPAVSEVLMASDEWIDVSKYARPEKIYNGEIGKLAGVRFVETPEAYVFKQAGAAIGSTTTKNDVYSTIVFGKGAYGCVELDGNNLRHIVKQRGSAGTADPLNQVATIGWKVNGFVAKILQGAWMVRIETGGGF